MYCPNCAAPIDGVKFCRSCGANVSLVPQALTGQLPTATGTDCQGRRRRRHHRDNEPQTIEKSVSTFFTGVGLLVVATIITFLVPAGPFWGWVFIIPAFTCMSTGAGHYLRLRQQERQQQFQTPFQQPVQPHQLNMPYASPSVVQSDPRLAESSAPTTSELTPPLGITEHTTKHLDASRRRE